MFKNKISNLVFFTFLVFVLFFTTFSSIRAESTGGKLPDNVKVTTSDDGSSTIVIINSKPGFSTNVQTNCVNGKCTSNAVSNQITKEDIQKMKNNIKKQQEAMEKFWKAQEEFLKQQQKMFQDIWKINWF